MTPSDHKWDIFSAGYHVVNPGDTLRFSKVNQPSHIKLTTSHVPFVQKTFECHWDSSLNWPDTTKGLLYLETPLDSTGDLHSGDEAYVFQADEWYGAHEGYPVPYVPFDGNDSTSGYQYHTYAMEWLPNEVRFLYDSVVLFRWPDHMVPPGNAYYDWVGTMSRSATNIHPAQFDLPSDTDVFGRTPGSAMFQVRAYFEHAASQLSWPGFETFDGKRAAHHTCSIT